MEGNRWLSILYKSAGRIAPKEAEFLVLDICRLLCGIVLTFIMKALIIFELRQINMLLYGQIVSEKEKGLTPIRINPSVITTR